ncbi:MAG: hypothetical protein R2874_03035 [Desulfobacterales bacterium]
MAAADTASATPRPPIMLHTDIIDRKADNYGKGAVNCRERGVLNGKKASDYDGLNRKGHGACRGAHQDISGQDSGRRIEPAPLEQDHYHFMAEHHEQNGKGDDQRQIAQRVV